MLKQLSKGGPNRVSAIQLVAFRCLFNLEVFILPHDGRLDHVKLHKTKRNGFTATCPNKIWREMNRFYSFLLLWHLSNYLTADDSDDDVLVVGAAPAQDVGALLVALLAQLLNGILSAGRGRGRNMQWENRSMQQGNHVKDCQRGASNIACPNATCFRLIWPI